jgi:hypothetical protein
MRKVIFPLAFIALNLSLVACSFSMRAGTGTNTPNANQGGSGSAAQQPAPVPSTAAAPTGTYVPTGRNKLGKRNTGQATGPTPTPSNSNTTPAPTPSTTPSVPPAGGPPVVSAATVFGSGTVDTSGFKGNIYWVPAGTTKLPQLASMQPNGFLFTKDINVTPQAFTTGFPGVDAARKENFAIRYEAPLIVTAEADYDFRIVSDDGAVLMIDNTPIVDNDGARTTPAEKSGPVHLVAGTHMITVDYLQTSGNVALQLFCKKANDTEKVCPTRL